MSATQQAKVKSVLSGDTLILTAINNPRNERTLSLAYVSAPRMRRGDDEVCPAFTKLTASFPLLSLLMSFFSALPSNHETSYDAFSSEKLSNFASSTQSPRGTIGNMARSH